MGKKEKKQQYYINEQIRADKMLVIDEEWNKIWEMTKQEALNLAQQEEKDLIQIWYNPQERKAVVKLIEYWKFMYQLKKQQKEKKKKQKVKWLKEIKFWYNIGKNDFELKIKKIEEFLKEGYNVKILGELRWRENWFKDVMLERLKEIESRFKDISKSNGIKEEKRWYSLILFAKVK
jgi:translation initiation factor IF-3